MSDGFLGRWARRKQAAQQGLPVEEAPTREASEVPSSTTADRAAASSSPPVQKGAVSPEDSRLGAETAAEAPAEVPAKKPPLGMDDVRVLTRQSDYRPFVAPDVAPEVRNAAMKMLFADPHFNEIDWLDVYMDDYSKPNPLPLSMMKKMASAKFLKMVQEDPSEQETPALAAQDAEQTVDPQALSDLSNTAIESTPEASEGGLADEEATPPAENQEDHDHSDLRLQQDHAAGPQGSGGGAG